MNKKEWRRKAESIRDSISLEEKRKLDTVIQRHLFAWKPFQDARYIFCYVSFRSEVDTHRIIKRSIEENKVISVPRINLASGEMRALIIDSMKSCLEPGAFGILSPKSSCIEVNYLKLDLIIAPGFAFTQRGDRLGYGGGFYDRFLKQHNRAIVCALTYDRLIFDHLPVKEHDFPVDYLISESGVNKTARGKR